jgi:hypothetical protein
MAENFRVVLDRIAICLADEYWDGLQMKVVLSSANRLSKPYHCPTNGHDTMELIKK